MRGAGAIIRRHKPLSFERLEERSLMAVTGVGGDLLVNTFTAGPQSTAESGSAIALSANGDGVIVFEGRGPGDRDGVFARRISAAGAPIGADFRVNETVREDQADASVAMRADGSFVVTWAGRGRGDQDGVFLRLFAANGTPLSGEILVSQTTAGKQGRPAVGMAPDGSIVIAWEGNGAGDVAGVFLRRFAANGSSLTGEILVNSPSPLRQSDPALAIQNDGSFLVAWTSRGQDGSDRGIFARRFNAAGQPIGQELGVNSQHSGDQVSPDVAAAPGGTYQVVWSSFGANDIGWDVKQAQISAAGAVGGEQRVNANTQGDQTQPKVAAASDGSTVVAWTSAVPDGSGREVMARDFAASGQPVQPEFPVPASAKGYASGHQQSPAVAIAGDRASIAWSGHGALDRHGVYVRGFQTGVVTQNHPPDLAAIQNMTVALGAELTFTATATDPDGNQLTFSLDPDNAPAGATIDPTTGMFRWTPTDAQAPGTFTVRVLVTDNGVPPLADSETFTVTVTRPNRAPNLTKPADRTIERGGTVTFTAMATDPDFPDDTLHFLIDPDTMLPGATINETTGEFRWQVPGDQTPGPYSIRLLVVDSGNPALADSESFVVTVQ